LWPGVFCFLFAGDLKGDFAGANQNQRAWFEVGGVFRPDTGLPGLPPS
jgi:hypothetical protein